MPQRSIHLNKHEFVSFVRGNYEDADTRKQIMILVRDRKERQIIKLLIIYIDPWKNIDYSEEPFDV